MDGPVPGGWPAAEQAEIWTRRRLGEALRTTARRFNKDLVYVRRFLLHTGGRRLPPRRRASGQLTAAHWLRRAYPDAPAMRQGRMRVSHEAIYLSLFVQSRGALKRELTKPLRTGRAMRFPRGARTRAGQGRGQLVGTVSIRERPAEVEDRAVPGHREGDLVFGRHHSAVGTLVERTTRYALLFPVPGGYRGVPIREALAGAVRRLPEQLRRSLTWDHGKEMSEHVRFTVDAGVQVYFCDPRSPWA